MVAYSRDVLNQGAADLYARLDRDGSGGISPREAGQAVTQMRRSPALRQAAHDVFGVVPASARELLRWVGSPPRGVAQARIFAFDPREVGDASHGASPSRVSAKERATLAVIMDAAGDPAAALAGKRMSKALQQHLCSHLCAALAEATTGASSRDKDARFSDAMALLLQLGRVCDRGLKSTVIDRALWGLSRQANGAMREFYLAVAGDAFAAHLDAPQRFAYDELTEVTVRSRFPVDAWTENRTKPLRVSEIVYPTFWRRVCGYYRSRGFKLLTKNAGDTRRTYERVIVDPSGSKAPLKVHVDLAQGEDNLYAKLASPNLHVLVYDGHWQLGGNGAQSIDSSSKSLGVPKLIVQDGCRTIQNYDELIDRHRGQMVIGSVAPIFVDAKPILDVIFEGIARGESLGWVRKRISKTSYFSRDEFEKLRQHADLDNDDRADSAAGRIDLHFDVYGRHAHSRFLSAIEYANTEVFYHTDHERDEGRRSYLGPTFADHIVAAGPLGDPKPGEVVRLTPVKRGGETFFSAAYNPAYTHRRADEYAGIVTAHVVMQLIQHKIGKLSEFDRMRAIVMGAAAIQFLGVYARRGNTGMKGYLAHFGLPAIPPKRMIEFLEQKEAYGNDDQTRRFIALVDRYRG